jgi:hypothetical protein
MINVLVIFCNRLSALNNLIMLRLFLSGLLYLSVFVLDGLFLPCADCGISQLADDYISEIKTAMTRCQYALEQAKNLKAESRMLKLEF